MRKPFILGLGGTSRNGSSSEKAMRVAVDHAASLGAETAVFTGEDLLLPHFKPGLPDRTGSARRLIDLFRKADGIVLCSPAYHGAVSGLIKNAIDYAEDLKSDRRIYWDGCAIGCICCAGGWQGGAVVLESLRSVAHALRGWPTPYGAVLNTSMPIFDAEGEPIDAGIRQQLEIVGAQVFMFSRMKLASTDGGRHAAAG